MAGRSIIIARDGDEAEIIRKNPLAKQHQILTLSPGAAAGFKDLGFSTIDTTDVYSDCSHARSVVNEASVQEEFRRLSEGLGTLSSTQINAAASTLFYMSGAASFYYQALRHYDKFYILNDKKLEEINGFENAFEIIVSRILKKRYGGRDHQFSKLHLWLMKKYNAHIDRVYKDKRKILIIDGSRPSSKSFAKEAVGLDPEIVVLAGRNPVKSSFKALRHMRRSLRTLKNKTYFVKRIPMYFIYPAPVQEFVHEAEQIAELAKPAFNRILFRIAMPYIADIFKLSAGYEASAKWQVEALRPDVVTADSLASGYTISIAKYTREIGGKVILFNHASHTPQKAAISHAIGNLWASLGRISSAEASYVAARSPAVARLSEELNPEGDIIGVRYDNKLPVQTHDKFKILFGGNYLGVENHVPWMLETPDEFIKGIAELVEAVGQIPEAELTIRVKPGKKDFDAEIMKKFVAEYPNVIVSNSGTMKEALAETDLMVASISTTVEEALQSGRPVLLYSWPKRYHHLQSFAKRRAVYTTSKDVPLPEQLRKIIAAVQDKPLSDEELAPYIWSDNELNMQGLAKRILEL